MPVVPRLEFPLDSEGLYGIEVLPLREIGHTAAKAALLEAVSEILFEDVLCEALTPLSLWVNSVQVLHMQSSE